MPVQAFCGACAMCKSEKTNLCGAVRKWTGNGIMRADDDVRFHHKESGKKIYHFVSPPHPRPAAPSLSIGTHRLGTSQLLVVAVVA